LIIAMDGWGSDLIDPWEFAQPGFIADYLNLRLLTRDENMKGQPLWAGEGSERALLQKSLEVSMGLIEGFKGALNAAKVKAAFAAFEVRGDHHLFIKKKSPDTAVVAIIVCDTSQP